MWYYFTANPVCFFGSRLTSNVVILGLAPRIQFYTLDTGSTLRLSGMTIREPYPRRATQSTNGIVTRYMVMP